MLYKCPLSLDLLVIVQEVSPPGDSIVLLHHMTVRPGVVWEEQPASSGSDYWIFVQFVTEECSCAHGTSTPWVND